MVVFLRRHRVVLSPASINSLRALRQKSRCRKHDFNAHTSIPELYFTTADAECVCVTAYWRIIA